MSNKLKGYDSFQGKIVGKITATGKSAYELWLDQGNTGTVQDFLNSLQAGGDKHFVFDTHVQSNPAKIWNITHNLEKFPSVTVVDSGEEVVYGNVEYISNNEVKITFTASFSGKAYLN